MKIRTLPFTAALGLMLPLAALAGGSAEIRSGAGKDQTTARIEFDGPRTLRMEGRGQQEMPGYMLLLDGKAYSVVQQDGSPMVMELGPMMKMMGAMVQSPAMQQPLSGPEEIVRFVSLVDSGHSETVAGVDGRVHTLTYVDGNGQTQTETLVLSKDARARELTAAMMEMGRVMSRAAGIKPQPGGDQLAAEMSTRGQGLLRYGNDFTLVSLDGKTPAGARFKLPAEPMQMPDLGGLMSSGGAGASGSASGSAGGSLSLPGIFGQKAERQQQRVEGRADAEVDQATDEAVDKALDKAFDKLFGN